MSTAKVVISKGGYERVPRVAEDKLVPLSSYAKGWLKIETYQELLQHEREILGRIEATQNGGNLFMANPFLLLEDIGVTLSARVRQEIVKNEPSLSTVSAIPYKALKESREKQHVHYHVHGLFPRRQQ